jgi:AraC family transcriptional regulator, regulatory protein of adaptative response / methylated-DNA-[protein]-cysteine methyltransferase
MITQPEVPARQRFEHEDDRWQAIVNRDRSAEGSFVLAVHTTGIFCRPGCPARTPKRENTSFFDTPADALRAGYRPCKRCRPLGASISERQAQLVDEARRAIEDADTRLTLSELAARAGMSPWHFQRLFKSQLGISPAQYQRSFRASRLREEITNAHTVTRAMNDAGFGSSSQFYATAKRELGMTPTAFRAGGRGERIQYGIVQTWLGYLLIAATDRGICTLQMGESEDEMRARLHASFPHAELIHDDADFTHLVQDVVALAEHPSRQGEFPLDMQGTAFQHRVWSALRRIPAGSTLTYSELAASIGNPKAVRAVAKACADNPVPLIVPCHRVIGKNGSLTGYRYGVARKQALLDREATGD